MNLSPPPLPRLSLPDVNVAIQNVTLAQRKATFSDVSTHTSYSENSSILSLTFHVAYVSLTQGSLATLSRKLLLSIGKSFCSAKCIVKLQSAPLLHSSGTQSARNAHADLRTPKLLSRKWLKCWK